NPQLAGRYRGSGPAGRHDRSAPAAQAGAEAGSAGDVRRRRSPRKVAFTAGDRARHPAGGKAYPRAREASDGEEPARVLPERAGKGDPEGTRGGRGWSRPRGDGQEDQVRGHAEGGAGEGRGRVQEAAPDVAYVCRSDGGAELH